MLSPVTHSLISTQVEPSSDRVEPAGHGFDVTLGVERVADDVVVAVQ